MFFFELIISFASEKQVLAENFNIKNLTKKPHLSNHYLLQAIYYSNLTIKAIMILHVYIATKVEYKIIGIIKKLNS